MNPARCKNDIQRKHIENIERTGVSILNVMEDSEGPGWAYTIGLWQQYRHPEVLVIGLTSGLTSILLDNINLFIRDESRRFDAGALETDLLEGYVCYFENIPAKSYGDWFAADDWFYGDASFPAVQLLWPNVGGTYPWDTNADDALRWVQPILTSLPKIH